MKIEKRVKQILRQWRRTTERANEVDGDIFLDEAKMPDLVLAYSLRCNFGWKYEPYFVIASRNKNLVANANAVNECSFIGQVPYWAWKDESYCSGSLPSELERAVASCYLEKKIPEDIKSEMLAHYSAIREVVEYCIRNQTDNLPT